MRKLTASQAAVKVAAAQSLRNAEAEIETLIIAANADIARIVERLKANVARIAEGAAKGAAEFVETVADAARATHDEGSERWQESPAGYAQDGWAAEWENVAGEVCDGSGIVDALDMTGENNAFELGTSELTDWADMIDALSNSPTI